MKDVEKMIEAVRREWEKPADLSMEPLYVPEKSLDFWRQFLSLGSKGKGRGKK